MSDECHVLDAVFKKIFARNVIFTFLHVYIIMTAKVQGVFLIADYTKRGMFYTKRLMPWNEWSIPWNE
jgi:hypothetical protein